MTKHSSNPDNPEQTNGGARAAVQQRPPKSPPQVPAAYAVIRKIRKDHGIHVVLGYFVVGGGLYTTELKAAAAVTAGENAEFEPFSDEDATKISRFVAEQGTTQSG